MRVQHCLKQEQSLSWVIFIFNNDVDVPGCLAYAFILHSISVSTCTGLTWTYFFFFMECSRPAGLMVPEILKSKDCVYIHDIRITRYWQHALWLSLLNGVARATNFPSANKHGCVSYFDLLFISIITKRQGLVKKMLWILWAKYYSFTIIQF